MSVLFLLIGISLLVALTFLLLFFGAVKKGQFDDGYTPSVRMLFDNNPDLGKRKPTEEQPDSKNGEKEKKK